MRLYQITDTTTKKPLKDMYFPNKRLAKIKRRELNGEDEQLLPSEEWRYVVSPGPDHYKYQE